MNTETIQLKEQQPPPNYVLIDGALWGNDLRKAKQKNKNRCSLYKGATGKELDSAAPYLFCVEADSEFEKWVKEQDPAKRHVMWLHSSVTLEELRKHFRRFLRMKNEKGTYIYFRFYSPRVFNCVFPHLTEVQRCDFFKEINYILTEDSSIDDRRVFHFEETENCELNNKPSGLNMWIITDEQMQNISVTMFSERKQRAFKLIRNESEFAELGDEELKEKVHTFANKVANQSMKEAVLVEFTKQCIREPEILEYHTVKDLVQTIAKNSK
ncbi:MAG: DUF4123 domain-containing protein [Dysgonamonadaceae bacterium]|jgi:hypothetical protein|nr:DUF4123 domain-containing protein [Dysgonamonadaceae bacterium]